jgi:alginate O-acetyltransferase complex protein AlgI
MLFASYSYLVFLCVAVIVHWMLPAGWRNAFLLLASCVFYGAFRVDALLLLLALCVFTWAYGRWILSRRPTLTALVPGVLVCLTPLVYFKYCGTLTGTTAAVVGISFYTFQSIAYLVDVASGEQPVAGLGDFLLFQAFWPKVSSGPILRIEEVRRQIAEPRTLDYSDVAEGTQRVLFGLAKKVLLADSLAPVADMVFRNVSGLHAVDAAAGTLAVGLAVYFDFSAYSDIAVGSARLVGFRLPENFNWPYLARSPQEFWNRWHMTLSRWIRDYLFTPLSFASRGRPRLVPVWLVLSMAICGLWHGAAWTFVVWGVWHGLLLVLGQGVLRPLFVRGQQPGRWLWGLAATGVTFVLVQVSWVLFRAESLGQAWSVLQSLVMLRGGWRPAVLRENSVLLVALMLLGLVVAQTLASQGEWLARRRWWGPVARLTRPVVFAGIVLAIIILDQEATAFVYFQF